MNCGEMGHTVKRCKEPIAEDGADGADGGVGIGNGGGEVKATGGWDTGDAAPTGDWQTETPAADSGGW
jgi:cellular nucleic acid-binding protein